MKSEFLALWADTPNSDPNKHEETFCEVKKSSWDDLNEGEVLIQTHYSGINYKDALAISGKGKILKKMPLIPGIDMSGVITASRSKSFREGDSVLINGANFGETMNGGFTEIVKAPADIVLPLPENLNLKEAMIYGTAGFTAALAIYRMEQNGLHPSKGPILVTGSTGGVGSLALCFLKKRGYESEAWTRREEWTSWLKECGATRVTNIKDLDFKSAPLAKATWSGAIDNIGGDALAYILARIDLWGSVASIGLAKSEKLETTVFPFILRGVNLLGTSSNNCPYPLRKEIWHKMANDYKPDNLNSILSNELKLEDLPAAAEKMIQGKLHGRTLVRFQH